VIADPPCQGFVQDEHDFYIGYEVALRDRALCRDFQGRSMCLRLLPGRN
jgi:hypothetical protein